VPYTIFSGRRAARPESKEQARCSRPAFVIAQIDGQGLEFSRLFGSEINCSLPSG